jgi:hypothetical protein
MMRKPLTGLILLVALLAMACAAAGPPTQPSDREWSLLNADYQWIQTLRNAQRQPNPSSPGPRETSRA